MAANEVTYRPARAADAEAIVGIVTPGFESYRIFAPEGWSPPAETPGQTRARLAHDGAWGLVAVDGSEIVGFGAFEPARRGRGGPPAEDLAHVFAIFVSPPWWGTGVATEVLGRVTTEMRERGYREARLFTPAGQARARAFYGREGWREVGGPFHAPEFDLDILELRRPL